MAQHKSFLNSVQAVARGRFTYLLAFMFVSILMFPFLVESTYGPPVMQVLYAFMFISALHAVKEIPWVFRMGILLFVVALVSHWWMIMALSPISVVTATFCAIVFFFFIALSLLFHVFGHEWVTGDTIAGAICVFLLIGIIWMLAYQAIHFFDPKAFNNVTAKGFSPAAIVDLAYFSFVTLTTVGYGDITPISRPVRMFVVTEAILGQIYLTVLVARLVGLYASVRPSRAGE
ncbi:MAG TPA: ion channel [Candidatus Binatia bacterium]|nr:ion channel [Candidatus Binatia bacterium]